MGDPCGLSICHAIKVNRFDASVYSQYRCSVMDVTGIYSLAIDHLGELILMKGAHNRRRI